MEQVTLDDFCNKDLIYQIGIAPNRIDIMMDIPGVQFSNAWQNRIKSRYSDTPIFIMDLENLIKAKQHSGRDQDLLDLKQLKTVKR